MASTKRDVRVLNNMSPETEFLGDKQNEGLGDKRNALITIVAADLSGADAGTITDAFADDKTINAR